MIIRTGPAATHRDGRGGLLDDLIEAGWLAALATVPVFFDAFTFRSFEPDKAAVLRAIALVMATAWLVKGVAGFAAARRSIRTRVSGDPAPAEAPGAHGRGNAVAWTLAAALALMGWTALTAVFSIAPGESLIGSYHRDQGLITLAAYFAVFLSMAALGGSVRQRERAVTAALLASCPIAVYALVQHVALDPMPWGRATERPVVSTMGNAIFMAGFLVMLVPLSAARLLGAAARLITPRPTRVGPAVIVGAAAGTLAVLASWVTSPSVGALVSLALLAAWLGVGSRDGRRLVDGAAVGTYSTLLALQLGAILTSASRGPFLGLLCGGFVFALLLAVRHRHRGALIGMGGLALSVLAFFALVRTPDSPLRGVQELPIAGRLASVLDTGGTARVRLLLWQQALDTLTGDPPRALVGHGPETQRIALAPDYPPALGQVEDRLALPDRAHNETLDRLITTGLIGTTLYYALLFGLFSLGLERAVATRADARPGRLLAGVATAALVLSAAARWLDGSWRLVGLTVPLGMVAGVALYAAWPVLLRRRSLSTPPTRATPREWLAIALVAGLVAHVVETHFGIATVSSSLYFWAFAALLLAIARPSAPAGAAAQPRADTNASAEAGRGELPAALATFALVILGLSFGFASAGVGPGAEPAYAWLLRVSFILCGLTILVVAWQPGASAGSIRLLELGAYHTSVFLAALLLPRLAVRWADGWLPGPSGAVTAYFVLLGAALLLLAASLRAGSPGRAPGDRARGALACLTVLVATMPAIWWCSIRPLQADVAFKRGLYALGQAQGAERAVAGFETARRLAPWQNHYRVYHARALASLGSAEADPARRDAWYARAETLLQTARERRPGDPDTALELGRIQARWAALSEDPAVVRERIERALASLRDALALSPGRVVAWNAYGSALAIAERQDEALERFDRSLALDPKYATTYLLAARAQAELGRPGAALEVLERGVRLAEPSASLHRALASRYAAAGRIDDADRELQRSITVEPGQRAGHVELVNLRLGDGDCAGAAGALREMARRLPGDPALKALRERLSNNCPEQTPPQEDPDAR